MVSGSNKGMDRKQSLCDLFVITIREAPLAFSRVAVARPLGFALSAQHEVVGTGHDT
jgi:hypothetical protein